jgi:hypothetical protein
MKPNSIAIGLCMVGIHATSAWALEQPRVSEPLFEDFNAANAGPEIAIPYFKEVDTNADGYPDIIKLRFDVYTAGTNTLLYSSALKSFATPAIPSGCTPTTPQDFNFSYNLTPRAREAQLDSNAVLHNASPRVHAVLNMELRCLDGVSPDWVTSRNVGVYSADLSSAAGTAWSRIFTGVAAWSFGGVDIDGDLITDKLLLSVTSQPATGGTNITVHALEPATGAYFVPSKTYPMIR